MLTSRIVPCLDVSGGRVVKGVRFQGLRDSGDPAERAAAYEAQGADELVVLDVSATIEQRQCAEETVARVRAAIGIPLTVGGGVRSDRDAEQLLEAGADKVAVNSAAHRRPELVEELARRFGSQCTVVAIDAGQTTETPTESGFGVIIQSGRTRTERDALDWAREVEARGAGELLLTSWDRDGTRLGYDLALLKGVCEAVSIPVIASGGARDAAHLADGLRAGASAVLAASMFHDGDTTVAAVKRELAGQGLEVRL